MNKSTLIRDLLLQGINPHDIAHRVGCKVSLVYTVRSNCARQLGIREHVPHVKMIHGPWVREPGGILSREIRGI